MSIWANKQRIAAPIPSAIEDCFIYLTDSQPIVKSPMFTTFAVDGAYPGIKPDVYITCTDEGSRKAVLAEPFVKIFRKKFQKQYSKFDNCLFTDLWLGSKGIESLWHYNPDNFHAFWCGSTLGVALSIIVFYGYKRIYFCGSELHGYENYRDRLFIAEFAELADKHGIECTSCTPGSSLNSFLTYTPLPV